MRVDPKQYDEAATKAENGTTKTVLTDSNKIDGQISALNMVSTSGPSVILPVVSVLDTCFLMR